MLDGIQIDRVAIELPFWPYQIFWYGIIIVIGIGLGAWWAARELKKRGLGEKAIDDFYTGLIVVVFAGYFLYFAPVMLLRGGKTKDFVFHGRAYGERTARRIAQKLEKLIKINWVVLFILNGLAFVCSEGRSFLPFTITAIPFLVLALRMFALDQSPFVLKALPKLKFIGTPRYSGYNHFAALHNRKNDYRGARVYESTLSNNRFCGVGNYYNAGGGMNHPSTLSNSESRNIANGFCGVGPYSYLHNPRR